MRQPTEKFAESAQAFHQAIDGMLAEDYVDTLSVVTGTFVSLTLEVMRRHGHERIGEVLLKGGENRDITIHAPKQKDGG